MAFQTLADTLGGRNLVIATKFCNLLVVGAQEGVKG